MFVTLQFDNQLDRLIEARHDELSRQVVSVVIAQKFLEIKLFTHTDFAGTFMAVWAYRERLVVAVGRLEED
jgi:hypothetical protein